MAPPLTRLAPALAGTHRAVVLREFDAFTRSHEERARVTLEVGGTKKRLHVLLTTQRPLDEEQANRQLWETSRGCVC